MGENPQGEGIEQPGVVRRPVIVARSGLSAPELEGDALASIEAPVLIAAPPLDLFNPAESARKAAQAIRNARLLEIPSVLGHSAASAIHASDGELLNRAIREFLLA